MTSISRRGRFSLGSAFATLAISAGIMHSYAVFLVLSIVSYLGGSVAFWARGRPARRYPV